MSCFLLPKTTCDEINAILSEIWWGKGDERRKISWVSWNRLCLLKKEGGVDFQDLYSFNIALLEKKHGGSGKIQTLLLVHYTKEDTIIRRLFYSLRILSMPLMAISLFK